MNSINAAVRDMTKLLTDADDSVPTTDVPSKYKPVSVRTAQVLSSPMLDEATLRRPDVITALALAVCDLNSRDIRRIARELATYTGKQVREPLMTEFLELLGEWGERRLNPPPAP